MNSDEAQEAGQLTDTQQRILDCITSSVKGRGYPPTLREIGNEVGLKSTASVSYQLSVLEARKIIKLGRVDGIRRRGGAITLVNGHQKPVKLTVEELAQLPGLGDSEVAAVEKILNDRLNATH